MKKIIKRLLTGVLALATAMTTLPITQVQAAANNSVLLEKHPDKTYQFDSSFPAPFGSTTNVHNFWTFKMNQNNNGNYKSVYCIQYGVAANTGDAYDHQNDISYLNAIQKKQLQKALMFGYNDNTGALYGGSWVDNAIATQAMVWVITTGQYGSSWESRIVDRLLASSSAARSIYNQIRANMEHFEIIPSFAASSAAKATDYELKYNMNNGKYELTLEDTRNVIKYFDFKGSGITVQRNGSKLLLSSDKDFDTTTLKANKNLPKDVLPTLISGTPEYWHNPTQQNMASLNLNGSYEVPAYLKLHTEKIGHIQLKKTSEDGKVDGLRFRITGNGIDRIVTTEADGTILIENLVAGDYAITEVDTPNKYVQPKTQIVTVKPAKTSSVTFDNILKKFNIHITKSDTETGSTPQGDASLDGAEYDIYDSQGYLADHVIADGETATSKLLVLGTYNIYEVIPPTGYTLNNDPITVTGDFDGQTVEIGRADTGISDRVIKGQVAVTKFADAPLTGDTEEGGVKQPLEGIEFTLTLKSTGEEASKMVTDADGYAITPMLPYGLYRIEETVGAEGYRKIEPFDIQIDSNGKIYKYILENTVYETDVKITKIDAETGRAIPLAGTQFKIKDADGNWVTQKYNYPTPTTIDTFETAADGALVLPEPLRYGSYALYEVKAPHGYTVSKEPVPFEVTSGNPSALLEVTSANTPVRGTVTIEKLGERFSGSDFRGTEFGVMFAPIYELQALEGIPFDIIAAEDITTPDGTVRAKKGTVMDTITTGADGTVASKELYLGKYQAVEKNTLDGFILDVEAHSFELTYKDQNTAIVTTSARVENVRQKAKVSLSKVVETVCNQTYNPLPEVRFGLYAREDILTAGSEVGFAKDSLLDVIGTDESGNGTFNVDLPTGSYFVKELATGKGYSLDATEYNFTFQHMGQEVPEIHIHVNDGKPVKNVFMRGAIEISKTSEDKKIEGISFKVTGTTEIGTHYEKVFQTDKDGKIHIDKLLIGTYKVSEVIDDLTIGYITPDSQTVTVSNGETSQVEMKNQLIRGGFQLQKVDEDKIPLSGVKFVLFTADGKKLHEFVTDKDGTYRMDNLLYGDYYLKELEAPKGYELDKKEIHAFSITEDKQVIEIKVVNKKIPEKPATPAKPETPGTSHKLGDSPKTGDTTNIIGLAAILTMSAAGLASVAYKRYRRLKKESDK